MVAWIRSDPRVQYGFTAIAVAGCTYLWTQGLSHHNIMWVFVGIAAALILAGLVGGIRLLLVVLVLSCVSIYVFALHICPPELHWVTGEEFLADPMYFHGTAEPALEQLRRQIGIEQGMNELGDDTARALFLTDWVADQWAHSGSNQPSNPDPLTILREAGEGSSFRCVEYAIVLAGTSQAMGMPARVVGLKTRRADTARSGAGHVVTEIWLDDLGKWAFADGQFGYMVTLDGTPLSAVELQQALARGLAGLEVVSGEGPVAWLATTHYLIWINPYLYHFDFALDQRHFLHPSERQGGALMLIPSGKEPLEVFQRQYPLWGYTYTSNLEAFYREPGY